MIQGGDPTGTGRGGESIWGKNFDDEFDGPLKHDARGTISMANKGKNTNSSQFFIAYRALPHLNNKHTVFGRLVDDPSPSSTTLNALELAPVDPTTNKPKTDICINDVTIFLDPFEEFMSNRQGIEEAGKQNPVDDGRRDQAPRREEDELITWTGKRIRGFDNGKASDVSHDGGGVGKYLKAALADRAAQSHDEIAGSVGEEPQSEHVKKKIKSFAGRGGFGNFNDW